MDKTKLKIIAFRKRRKDLLEDNPYLSDESLVRLMMNKHMIDEDKQSLSERGHYNLDINAMDKSIIKDGVNNMFNIELGCDQQPPKGGFDI